MNDKMRHYKRRQIPGRVRWTILLRNGWPALVWLTACVFSAWLYYMNPRLDGAQSIRGMVDAEAVVLSPVETARIERIHVHEGQRVRQGDLLIELDTALIAHGVTSDLLDAIRIESAFGDTHQDVLQAFSQRRDAIAAIETDIIACRQEWVREAAQLDALRVEQRRRDELHRQRIIDELTRMELLPELQNLEQAVALYPARLQMYERQLDEARTYHRHMMEWLGAEEDQPISVAIRARLNEDAAYTLLEEAKSKAELHTKAYTIRAPRDGTVSQILHRESEVVPGGEPILRLVNARPTTIQAYVGEEQLAAIRIGQRLRVNSNSRPNDTETFATVMAISPELHASAYTLSATGRAVPLRAQRATLRIDGPHRFVGGESVMLLSLSRGVYGVLDAIFGRFRAPEISAAGA